MVPPPLGHRARVPTRVVRLCTDPECSGVLPRPLDQPPPIVYSYWTVRASHEPPSRRGVDRSRQHGHRDRRAPPRCRITRSSSTIARGEGRGARGPRCHRRGNAGGPRRAGRRGAHVPRGRRGAGGGCRRGARCGAPGYGPRRHEHRLAGYVGAGRRARRGRVRRLPARAGQRQSGCRSRREPRASSSPARAGRSTESSRSSVRSVRPSTTSVTASRRGS